MVAISLDGNANTHYMQGIPKGQTCRNLSFNFEVPVRKETIEYLTAAGKALFNQNIKVRRLMGLRSINR